MNNMRTFKFKGQTYELKDNKSMYDVVVENGYKGTRQEFVTQLFGLSTLKARIEELKNKK